MAAGTYFVKELDMKKGNGARINIISEPVKLHIGKKFKVSAKQVSFNKGGRVTGFTVYLHRDSSFEAKEIDFTGVIYGPENKKS